jgi:hypothetical protein
VSGALAAGQRIKAETTRAYENLSAQTSESAREKQVSIIFKKNSHLVGAAEFQMPESMI